jgi:chloramphenicol 3-O phosphotransferase
MIVLLNGIPGVGKTTVGGLLRDMLPGPCVFIDLDRFLEMLSPRYVGEQPPADQGFLFARGNDGVVHLSLGPIAKSFLSGFHNVVREFASANINVVVAHLMLNQEMLDECVSLWSAYPVLFVGLFCSWEVAEQRVLKRGGLALGLARATFATLNAHRIYDLELDTSAMEPNESAIRIRQCVLSGSQGGAFEQLVRISAAKRSSAG